MLVRERVLPVALPLFLVAMIYPAIRGHSRIAQQRSAEAAFVERAHGVVLRNQQLARSIEERIAAGVETEQIPPPFGSRHPRYAATWSRPPAILPASSLSWLAIGQSELYAAGYGGPEHDEISQVTNPLKLRIGDWDVEFSLVYLLPLFVFVMAFDLIASDRESGRLQLALSQPLRARTILLVRAATAAIIVLGATAIPYVIGIVIGDPIPGDGMIARALMGGIAILAYAVFWLALTLGVNAVGRDATTNALRLMTLWLLFVVLIPFAIDQIATRTHPIPAHSEITNRIRTVPDEVRSIGREQLINEYLRRQALKISSTKELSSLAVLYLEGTARRAALEQRFENIQKEWENSLAQQQKLANRLAIISPSALLTSSLIEIAGTSRHRFRDFVHQKQEYEESYERFFLPRLLALPNSVFKSADYDLIPTMQYREIHSALVRRSVAPLLSELVVLSLISAIVAVKLSFTFR
jgi:ABC-2 type transport system permease protein